MVTMGEDHKYLYKKFTIEKIFKIKSGTAKMSNIILTYV